MCEYLQRLLCNLLNFFHLSRVPSSDPHIVLPLTDARIQPSVCLRLSVWVSMWVKKQSETDVWNYLYDCFILLPAERQSRQQAGREKHRKTNMQSRVYYVQQKFCSGLLPFFIIIIKNWEEIKNNPQILSYIYTEQSHLSHISILSHNSCFL